MEKMYCYCGGVKGKHNIGDYGCFRFAVQSPIYVGLHATLGCKMFDVGDGKAITEYTMREQRGYHQHENGEWSRWFGSTNSLSDET